MECKSCGTDFLDSLKNCPACGDPVEEPQAAVTPAVPPVPPAPAPQPIAAPTPAPATVAPATQAPEPQPQVAPATEPECAVEVMGHRLTQGQLELVLAAEDSAEAAGVLHDDFGTEWPQAFRVAERVRSEYGSPMPAAPPAHPLGQNVLTSLRGWLGKVNIGFMARWGAAVVSRIKQVKARNVWEGYKSFSQNAADRRTPTLAGIFALGLVLGAIFLVRVLVIPVFFALGLGILVFGRRGGFTVKERLFGVLFFLGGFVWLFLGAYPQTVIYLLAGVVRCGMVAELGLTLLGVVATLVANRSRWGRVELVLTVVVSLMAGLFVVGLVVPAKVLVPAVSVPEAKPADARLLCLVIGIGALALAVAARRFRMRWVSPVSAGLGIILLLVAVFFHLTSIFDGRVATNSTPTPTEPAVAAQTATPTATTNATQTAVSQAKAGVSTNTPAPTATPTVTPTPTNTPTPTATLKPAEPIKPTAAPTATPKPVEPTKPAPPIKGLSRQVKLTGSVEALRRREDGQIHWEDLGVECFDAKDRRIGQVVPLLALSQTVVLPEGTVQIKLWIGDLLGGAGWWKKYFVDHPRPIGSGDSPIVLTITSVFDRGRSGQ